MLLCKTLEKVIFDCADKGLTENQFKSVIKNGGFILTKEEYKNINIIREKRLSKLL